MPRAYAPSIPSSTCRQLMHGRTHGRTHERSLTAATILRVVDAHAHIESEVGCDRPTERSPLVAAHIKTLRAGVARVRTEEDSHG